MILAGAALLVGLIGPATTSAADPRFKAEAPELQKPGVAFVAHGHHLLAAPEVFAGNGEVDPKKLPSLDEDFPPGGVYGFYPGGEVTRLDKESK